jgi:molecular chaperone Hsp33
MEDYIVSATAADGLVRAVAAVTTNMVREAKTIHNLSAVASTALGRTLTAAALMSKSLKGEKNTLTIQIKGNGPLGGIIVVSDAKANVRGYVNNPDLPTELNSEGKLDVSGAVGKEGYVNVIKDLGLKEPYIGYVRLVSGEIAEDMAQYFYDSEQIPSVVSLGVYLDKDESIIDAGGFIIQLMPGATEDIITELENKISTLPPVTILLSEGKNPEYVLETVLGGMNLKIAEKSPCGYLCNCSRDRMESNLISLGEEEILDIIEEQHEAELHCHFCNRKYHFTEENLRSLLKK